MQASIESPDSNFEKIMRIATFDCHGQTYLAFWQSLQKEPDIVMVGNASTAEQALWQARFCDFLLIILPSRERETLELVRNMHTKFPHLKILLVCEQEDIDTIIRYVEAGIVGYILWDEPAREQARKLRATSQNKALVSPGVAGRLTSHLAKLAALTRRPDLLSTRQTGVLSKREEEILHLIGQGLTNGEIAQKLYLAQGTIKNHVHNILHKLNVANRNEAAAAYLTIGIDKYRRDTDMANLS